MTSKAVSVWLPQVFFESALIVVSILVALGPVAIEGLCDRETPPTRRDEHGHGHWIECHREVEELAGEAVVAPA
jgi:hypothetical protein